MRRKSLKTEMASLDKLTACITDLKNEFANLNTQIEVVEGASGFYFVEIWKI